MGIGGQIPPLLGALRFRFVLPAIESGIPENPFSTGLKSLLNFRPLPPKHHDS
jgi:hypothetical protein